MSGHSEVRPTNGAPLTPLEWLLETMTRPDRADQLKIFRVQDRDLASVLGADKAELQYFSYNDITNQIPALENQATNLLAKEFTEGEDAAKLRNPYQQDLMHLYNSLVLYNRLKNSLEPEGAKDFRQEVQVYLDSIGPGKIALQQADEGKQANEQDLDRIEAFFKRYDEVSRFAYPLIIPPLPGQPRNAWSNIGTNLMLALRSGELSPAATNYAEIASDYRNEKPAEFNRAIAQYRVTQDNDLYPALKKGGEEFFFNQTRPFSKAMAPTLRRWVALFGLIYLSRFGGRDLCCWFWHLSSIPSGLISCLPGRATAGDELVFVGHFHWVGCVFAGNGAGTGLAGWDWIGGCWIHRIHDFDHRTIWL